jgi:hypothetical protein
MVEPFLKILPLTTIVTMSCDILNDLPAYHELALSSLREFETRLSWDVAQEKACNLFRDLVN